MNVYPGYYEQADVLEKANGVAVNGDVYQPANNKKGLNKLKVYVLFSIFVLGCLSSGLGAMLLLVIGPFFCFKGKRESTDRIVKTTFVLCIATMIFSVSQGLKDPVSFAEEIAREMSWIVLALLGTRFTEKEARLFFQLFILSLFICAPLIVIQSHRYEAYFVHANHLAYYCLLPVIHFLLTTDNRNRWLYVGVLFMFVLITISSGGVCVLMLVLLTYYLVERKTSVKIIVSMILSITGFIAIAYFTGAIGLLYDKVSVADYQNIIQKADRHSFGSEGSFVWRVTYWLAIYDEFIRSSTRFHYLFGEGLKAVSEGNYIYPWMRLDPHNDFLRLLVERGLIGGLFFLIILGRMIRKTGHRVIFAVALFIPMFFGNIIVDFGYMFSLIIFVTMLSSKYTNCYGKKLEDWSGNPA